MSIQSQWGQTTKATNSSNSTASGPPSTPYSTHINNPTSPLHPPSDSTFPLHSAGPFPSTPQYKDRPYLLHKDPGHLSGPASISISPFLSAVSSLGPLSPWSGFDFHHVERFAELNSSRKNKTETCKRFPPPPVRVQIIFLIQPS